MNIAYKENFLTKTIFNLMLLGIEIPDTDHEMFWRIYNDTELLKDLVNHGQTTLAFWWADECMRFYKDELGLIK